MLQKVYSYFFNKANQIRENLVKKESEGPWDDWAQTKLVGDPPVSSAGSLTYSPSGSAQIIGTGNDSYLASVQGSYATIDNLKRVILIEEKPNNSN